MRTFSIPGTTLQPSVIGLGAAGFGSEIPEEESFRMMDAFVEAGGTHLNTANVYAAWAPGGVGMSERTVGKWLKASGARMMVATKGGHPDLATMAVSRLSPECLERDLTESLERLQLDSVDLYYLHRDDPGIPVGEILDALQGPVKDGRVRALGASNWSPSRLMAAEREARMREWTGFCCSQCGWSLAETNPTLQGRTGMFYVDAEALAFYRETRFPLIAYGAQAQGFFAQTWSWPELARPTAKQEGLRLAYYSERNVRRWERAVALARKRSCTASAIALAYVTSQGFPTGALIGARSVGQLRESLEARDLELEEGEVRGLEG